MLSRRSFLASSAALVAAPALGAVPASGEVDVAIVGAGAAGIAAARRVAAAKARFALLEAGNGIGGRCVTDAKIFGMPFDLGAHWIHNPDRNPLSRLAPKAALDIYPAPRGQTVRIGPRNARDAELENFLSLLVRSHRAIADAGRAGADVAAAALPRDLGDWRATIEFILGPYACGKDLNAVSAMDLARATERDADAFCRQGYGALLARLAADLPVRLATPVRRIEWDRKGVDVETRNGMLRARTVIVTVSTNVLAGDKIDFRPGLSKRQLDAAAKLSLGSFDHIALDMPGNPLGLQRDDVVFEQSTGARTAALLANVSGTSLHLVEVAGDFGRELAAQGRAAMVDFADRLAGGAVRLQCQERDQAQPRHALERGAVGARRHVGGRAGQRRCAPDPDGAGRRPHLVRRRGGARYRMGHGRRRLGFRHARGRGGVAPDGPAQGAGTGGKGAGQATGKPFAAAQPPQSAG